MKELLKLSLLCFMVSVSCQIAPYVSFMGETLPDHSFVNLSLVGNDGSGNDSVQCHTDLSTCCRLRAGAVHIGDWYFPNEDGLPFYDTDLTQYRDAQRVDLRRNNAVSSPSGIYRCDIATNALHDDNDLISARETVYVGIYATGGDVIVADDIRYTLESDINEASSQLILTCTSTGGPATTVTWTRDSVTVTEGSETVLDEPVTARYTHTLTVTTRQAGVYTCTVANNKPSSDSARHTIQAVSLTLRNTSIPTDGSARILITDVGDNAEDALTCRSRFPINDSAITDWYFHPTQATVEEEDTVVFNDIRGWSRSGVLLHGDVLVRLIRASSMAEEGMFTCQTTLSSEIVTVGIYYPITLVQASFLIISRRQKTYQVQCVTIGGRTLEIFVYSPHGLITDLTNSTEALGVTRRMGSDRFSARTEIITGGEDGDTYICRASNGVANAQNGSVELRVANPPTLLQLEQIALTSVRVKWTNTAGRGAPVTLYGIHYSDGINPRIKVVPATMTTTNITGLATGGTYTFSVEAGSEHLSGESQERTITLFESVGLQCPEIITSDSLVHIDCEPIPLTTTLCSFDDGPTQTCNLPLVLTLDVSPPGPHSVKITATNKNFVAQKTVQYSLSKEDLSDVKTSIPPIEIIFLNGSPHVTSHDQSGGTTSGSVTAEFVISRPVAGVRCYLRSQYDRKVVNCSLGSVAFSELSPGLYVLKIHAHNRRADIGIIKRGFVVN